MEDATGNSYNSTLSLAKCWQGREPFVCFQATWTTRKDEGVERIKGYFIVDARRGKKPLHWQSEKPDDLTNQGNASTLIRKFTPSSMVVHMHMGGDLEPFVALKLKTSEVDEYGNPFYVLAITGTTQPQMDFISGSGTSLFRWNNQGCYTVRKPAEEYLKEALRAEESSESVKLLVGSLLPNQGPPSDQPQPIESPAEKSGPSLPLQQREARDRIARRVKTLKKTITQDQSKVPSIDHIAKLKIKAEALRSWIHLVKEGQHELILDQAMVGQSFKEKQLVIELDPDLTAGENLNRMFIQLQKSERAHALGSQRVEKMTAQLHEMERSLEILRADKPISTSEIAQLLSRSGLQANSHAKASGPTKETAKATLGRTFVSSDQALMVLGRTAIENDAIVKSAKSNDWWFHVASGAQGTHVIVPARSLPKGEISANTIREAMILAVHFSNLALSKEGEVYVSKRGALKKNKGAPAGLWQINRSETMMIRYTDDDLRSIFTREKRAGTIRSQEDERP